MLEAWAKQLGATIESATPIQYGTQYRLSRGGEQAIVNIYEGKAGTKVVVQKTTPLADALRELAGQKKAEGSGWTSWCGSDESGKGDYFGPLAVAAVALTSKEAADLATIGVRDCKTMSDVTALGMDERIRKTCVFKLAGWLPVEYNAKQAEFRNVNRMLGELHAEAIAGVLEKRGDLEAAVVDQFGDEAYVREALVRRDRTITLVQRPKADETDLAVAAASVVARAAFLRGLAKLGKEFKARLPKGAGPDVIVAARAFVRKHGRDALDRVAKVHFKTTASV